MARQRCASTRGVCLTTQGTSKFLEVTSWNGRVVLWNAGLSCAFRGTAVRAIYKLGGKFSCPVGRTRDFFELNMESSSCVDRWRMRAFCQLGFLAWRHVTLAAASTAR